MSLERIGRLNGCNDLFIVAHACALGFALVTGNLREFDRVTELVLENWLLNG